MSKKDKSKFRKQLKAQMLQEMAKEIKPENIPTPTISPPSKVEVTPKVAVTPVATTIEPMSPIGNLDQIRYDLKKTGVVVLILALVIGIMYFLDYKYNILLTFGNWLFKVLNIQ